MCFHGRAGNFRKLPESGSDRSRTRAELPALTPMSRLSKPDPVAYLNDTVLGAFIHVPQSETINHLVRYLSTWGGSELRNLKCLLF